VDGVETAIVVVVPEAEKVVGEWRRRHTSDGADGMPAHLTLLYPFADTSQYLAGTDDLAESACEGVGPIRFSLSSTEYFYGSTNTLYLTPDPSAPFASVTEALMAAFPEYPPYGGAFSTVVPHLSVAQHESLSTLVEIEEQLKPALPIAAFASEAQLMEHAPAPDGWRLRRSFALMPPARPDPGA
jgi:2'-5' RNA ligase superfamily